eukprot:1180468-Prorocentrum_minimum.AAC.2
MSPKAANPGVHPDPFVHRHSPSVVKPVSKLLTIEKYLTINVNGTKHNESEPYESRGTSARKTKPATFPLNIRFKHTLRQIILYAKGCVQIETSSIRPRYVRKQNQQIVTMPLVCMIIQTSDERTCKRQFDCVKQRKSYYRGDHSGELYNFKMSLSRKKENNDSASVRATQ